MACKFNEDEKINEINEKLRELRKKLEEETDFDPERDTNADVVQDSSRSSIKLTASTKDLFFKIKQNIIELCQDRGLGGLAETIEPCGSDSSAWSTRS